MIVFAILFAAVIRVAPPSPAATAAENRGATQRTDEFFIISSVDTPHARIVMKRPTDVTVVVTVPQNAKLHGEHGEPLHLTDFRSGDTVYAVISPSLVATSIRRGPMTIEELRRRYLPELPAP